MEGLPENTLASFSHAMKANADVIEFDVWITKDGQVVVFHDADFERMCGSHAAKLAASGENDKHAQGEGKAKATSKKLGVADLAYADLPEIWLEDKEKHWAVNDKNRHLAMRIPLFSDLLKLVPQEQYMIIEFKQMDPSLIQQVHALVLAQGRHDRVMWFSLSEGINLALHAHDPTIPHITSVMGMLKGILLYYTGLLPFLPLREDVFGIPVDEVDYKRVREQKLFNSLPDVACRILTFFLGGKPPLALIPRGLFTHLRARGIPVFFLGVNDEEDIKVAEWAGATGCLTDRPTWLNKCIKEGKVVLQRLEE